MAIGDEFVPQAIRAFDWAVFTARCGLPPRLVARELSALARASLGQLDAVSAAVREEDGDRETLERITEVVRRQVARALEAAPLVQRAYRDEIAAS